MGISRQIRLRAGLGLGGLVAMVLLVSACGRPSAQGGTSGTIQIKGSDTMVNLGSAWAEEFMRLNPDVRIAVTGGGSGTGIAALIDRNTDIAQASRAIKAEEVAKAKANGVEPTEFHVARDGLSVIVNPQNPISELTFDELIAIYTGRITKWKDLGWRDAPIVALSRDTNSGTHIFFKEHVVQFRDPKAEYGPTVQMMASSKVGVDEVAANPNAIMYVGLGYVTDRVKTVAIRKDKSSPAVTPSLETVSSGEYSLARPLFFYTDGAPRADIKTYIDWVLGPEGQRLAQALDFVPVK